MIPQLPSVNQCRRPRDGVRAAERAGVRYRSFAAFAGSPPLTPQTPMGCSPRQIVPCLSTIRSPLPSGRIVRAAVVLTSVSIADSEGGGEEQSRSVRMQATPANAVRAAHPSPETTRYRDKRCRLNVIASPSNRALFSGRPLIYQKLDITEVAAAICRRNFGISRAARVVDYRRKPLFVKKSGRIQGVWLPP